MGQYYLIANLNKRQYIYPHKFGDGLKLTEFGQSGWGTMFALALLLSNGNGQGGGDFFPEEDNPFADLIGSWAGNRIVICGDYAEKGYFLPESVPDWKNKNLYDVVRDAELGLYEDISDRMVALMCDDKDLYERIKGSIWSEEYKPDAVLARLGYKPKHLAA